MKYSCIYTFLTLGLFLQTNNLVTAQLYDFFPLNINSTYSYSYFMYYSSSFQDYFGDPGVFYYSLDSGKVEYKVVDSLMINDSTIRWYIQVFDSLLHRRVYSSTTTSYDSLYFTNLETLKTIEEKNIDFHEINSRLLIWNFPEGFTRYFSHDSTNKTILFTHDLFSDNYLFKQSIGLTSIYGRHSFSSIKISVNYLKNVRLNEITNINAINQDIINYYLTQNFPNPFNSTTKIRYNIVKREKVTLKIYDLLGREIATLINEEKSPGEYEVEFNTEKFLSSSLTSGVYFYRLQAGDFSETKKIVLLR
ncbi:MAG: T9SS type A sorting domain-containing protein [Bacteroidetes bacterium]|nr:T9SS type A sorting domain-containing protein [Bacteroidota bacterium]MBU2585755.1 T9SS type A sorting domain-containing protein [Bacteroidota bacterium]